MTSGLLQGIEDGWFTGEIAAAAYRYQLELEEGHKRVVGVNSHVESIAPVPDTLLIGPDVEAEQRRVLAERRALRDQPRVDAALTALLTAARGTANLVPPVLEAARAEATLGEICGVLVQEWGRYTEPPGF
jgi:methylmalonyl-CoA mutase N-terminal domain/subunit